MKYKSNSNFMIIRTCLHLCDNKPTQDCSNEYGSITICLQNCYSIDCCTYSINPTNEQKGWIKIQYTTITICISELLDILKKAVCSNVRRDSSVLYKQTVVQYVNQYGNENI